MTSPEIPVVPLREAAAILGIGVEAARSRLRVAGVHSGYPLAAVEWLRDHPAGQGARTDILRCGRLGCASSARLVAGGMPWCSREHIPTDVPHPA